ncbi:MAG: hypothetical protein JWL90_331 [Chthoniobacteraceae bacterium]|nr:hypothetical protein [Chthoniobacteraceae bacterium]
MKGHKKSTHPSDAVFSYESPLEHGRVYITTDLKSYAKKTINRDKLEEALQSLSISTECANQSEEWQQLYADPESNHRVYGMLFIYNHDGEYDKDFTTLLALVKQNLVKVKANYRLFVFGPHEITYLYNVANDILRKRGAGELPAAKHCKFYHPDLVRSRVTSNTLKAATAEMLLSKWQVLEYEATEVTNNQKGYVVYYRESASSVDELKFLIDYFFRYQLVADSVRIEIRAPFADPKASAFFATAKEQYAKEYFNFPEFEKRLGQITFSSIPTVLSQFSTTELGMD